MKYIIETKDDKVLIEAEDRDHAFAKYFYDVINEKVSVDKLGAIIILKDGEDEYPFRTAPLLWKMGVLGTQHAVTSITTTVGVSRKGAKAMLETAAKTDARLIPLIEDLRLGEEGDEFGKLPDGMRRGIGK